MESTVVGADVFRTGCLGYVIHCHLHSFCSPVIICRTYNDHLVCIEFINYDPSSNAQKRLRDICVKVNHENIVKCYGYYRTTTFPRNINWNLPRDAERHRGEQLVFVMEKADCNLNYYLRKNELSYEERKRLIVEIATGFEYLSKHLICHHDSKVCLYALLHHI